MASSRNSGSPERFLERVAAGLRLHLPADSSSQRLVAGLSGGRDSVALLSALKELQPLFGYRLAACHVNHGISAHAAEWEGFCNAFCADLGVSLSLVSVTVPRNSAEGLEAAARAARYEAFSTLDADWLLLAQHRGDQAETLLFNLLRGAGLQGAAAMPVRRTVRPGLDLLRPLLGISRREVDAYLRARSLRWVEDESNADVRFSRNFLRHRIIPEMKSRFPAAEERLASSAARFAETGALLDDLAMLDLDGARTDFPVDVGRLAALSEARGRNVLRFLLARHNVAIPGEKRLREALRQLLEAKVDRHPSVIFGEWRLFRKRGQVRLEKIVGDET